MREILFRGKAIDDNWYYGVPLIFTEDYVCMTAPHTYNKAVIPETVGQYTGLTDKNDKKIFEGDIIASALFWLEQPKNGVAIFRNGSFGLLWYRGKVEQFNPFTSMCNVEYEVIGNIHDNPELFKGENPKHTSVSLIDGHIDLC